MRASQDLSCEASGAKQDALRSLGEGVTVVHCDNWLGRTYLAMIAPFHRVIARASLEQAARAVEG